MLEKLVFIIVHYVFIAVVVFVCYLFGKRLLLKIKFKSVWEDIVFSTGLGLGLLAYGVFFLGLAHLLTTAVLLITIGLGVAVSFLTWPGLAARLSWRNLRWPGWNFRDNASFIANASALSALALMIVLLFFFLNTWKLPLYPPVTWDATEYHLAAAKAYINAHGLVLTPYLRYPVNPQLNEMLFTLALALYDDVAAQLFQYLLLALTALAVYAFAIRYFSRRAGLLAAALLLGSPLMVWSGAVAYIDIGLTWFVTLSLFAFFNSNSSTSQVGNKTWLALCAVFSGFAAAVKYPALFFTLLFGLGVLARSLRQRRWIEPIQFAVITLVVACPFYLRNLFYSGNPFFPYFNNFFPETLWSHADMASQALEQAHHGLPHTLLAFLQLPWKLVFKDTVFSSEVQGFRAFQPLLFFLLPLSAWFAVRQAQLRKVLFFALEFIVFWFMTVQVLRYLMPIIPLLSLVGGTTLDQALVWLDKFVSPRLKRLPRQPLFVTTLLIMCALLLMLPSMNYVKKTSRSFGSLPVRAKGRDTFLSARLPSYPVYQILNQRYGSDYTIYSLMDENMAYFADGRFMGDWFGPARYSLLLASLADGEAVYRYVRGLGADYFLIVFYRMQKPAPDYAAACPEHFREIYRTEQVLLYELTDSHPSLACGGDIGGGGLK